MQHVCQQLGRENFGSGWIGVAGFLCVCRPDVFFLHGEKRWLCTDPKGAIEYEQRIWINDDAGNPLPIGLFDAWSATGVTGPGEPDGSRSDGFLRRFVS